MSLPTLAVWSSARPLRVVISTGTLLAMASSVEMLNPSEMLGKTNTSAAASRASFAEPYAGPVNVTFYVNLHVHTCS